MRGSISGTVGGFVIGTVTAIVEDEVIDGTLWVKGWLCWIEKCRSNGKALRWWGDEDAAEIVAVIEEVWNGKLQHLFLPFNFDETYGLNHGKQLQANILSFE